MTRCQRGWLLPPAAVALLAGVFVGRNTDQAVYPFCAVIIAFLAVFLLICIWIAEVFISTSNRKAGLGGIIGGIAVVTVSNPLTGLALIAAALVCAGLAIFLFFGCL